MSDPLSKTGQYRAIEAQCADHRQAISAGKEKIARWRAAHRVRARRVLVVDDHELVRATFLRVLDSYDVRLCASAPEAMRELETVEYDVVIADLDMPEVDGEEFIQSIRRFSRRPQVPVILVSGLADEDTLARVAERTDAVGWFGKPFDVAAFQRMVKDLVEA